MVTIAQSMFEHGNEARALSIITTLADVKKPEPLSHADATWIVHAFSYLTDLGWMFLVYWLEKYYVESVWIVVAE